MTSSNIFHPIGPLGSIIIGLAMLILGLVGIHPAGVDLSWLGLAFLLGGSIMLMVRIMNNKKDELPR